MSRIVKVLYISNHRLAPPPSNIVVSSVLPRTKS